MTPLRVSARPCWEIHRVVKNVGHRHIPVPRKQTAIRERIRGYDPFAFFRLSSLISLLRRVLLRSIIFIMPECQIFSGKLKLKQDSRLGIFLSTEDLWDSTFYFAVDLKWKIFEIPIALLRCKFVLIPRFRIFALTRVGVRLKDKGG